MMMTASLLWKYDTIKAHLFILLAGFKNYGTLKAPIVLPGLILSLTQPIGRSAVRSSKHACSD